LNRVKSQDIIHRGLPPVGDTQGVQDRYEIYLAAFGNETLARKAQSRAAEQLVDLRTKRGN
jgi:hypothetical protein